MIIEGKNISIAFLSFLHHGEEKYKEKKFFLEKEPFPFFLSFKKLSQVITFLADFYEGNNE